jgi:hypothetical protein
MPAAHTQLVITARPGPAGRPQRIRQTHVEWVCLRMSDRDFAILETECGHLNWPRLGVFSSRILAPSGP